jgi:DNA-binding NarL/FixJ family response regulator
MKSTRIMIIENHHSARIILFHWLRMNFPRCGFQQARNGEEALEKARTKAPDIVLMDAGSPNDDAVEAVHQVRSALPSAQVVLMAFQNCIRSDFHGGGTNAAACVEKESIHESLIPVLSELINRQEKSSEEGE